MQRELNVKNYDELVIEIQRLHHGGYEKLGNWNLTQICHHCNFFMQMYVDDYSQEFKRIPWLLKVLVGKPFFNSVMKKKGMKAGGMTPQKPLPSADLDEATQVHLLLDTIKRLTDRHAELFLNHPFFGKLTREQALEINLIHTVHHLRFLQPKKND